MNGVCKNKTSHANTSISKTNRCAAAKVVSIAKSMWRPNKNVCRLLDVDIKIDRSKIVFLWRFPHWMWLIEIVLDYWLLGRRIVSKWIMTLSFLRKIICSFFSTFHLGADWFHLVDVYLILLFYLFIKLSLQLKGNE